MLGFDLSSVFPEEKNGKLKGWWERMIMGFGPSPYLVTKDMLVVEERVRGSRWDSENVFRWHSVTMNLPGMSKYNPSKPWVYKVRQDGTMAADLFFYIDDGRPTAPSAWECWCASRKICCNLIWHGLQDAGRKRTGASQSPGEWAGTMVETVDGKVVLLVPQKKRDRGKAIVKRV